MNNVVYGRNGYRKAMSQFYKLHALGTQPNDFRDTLGCESVGVMRLSPWSFLRVEAWTAVITRCLTTLGSHVVGIILWRALKQMPVNPHTSRVVAAVEHPEVFINAPVCEEPCDSVSFAVLVSHADNSIAARISMSRPSPARAKVGSVRRYWTVFINLFPECLRCSSWMCHKRKTSVVSKVKMGDRTTPMETTDVKPIHCLSLFKAVATMLRTTAIWYPTIQKEQYDRTPRK